MIAMHLPTGRCIPSTGNSHRLRSCSLPSFSATARDRQQERVRQAAPVLAKALAQDPTPRPEQELSPDRFTWPYFRAVVEIGRPAVQTLLENIQTTDDPVLRNRSMDVLSHILGGKRRTLDTLRRLAATPGTASRDLAAKADHVNAAIRWAEGHYKQPDEPLY